MISAYIIMSVVAILMVIFAVGLVCFIQSIRVETVCNSSKTDYPKSMVALSESKVVELPTKKENFSLCLFKNGKKIKYQQKEDKKL